MADVDFVLRLLLAAGCGMLIGLERQYRSRTAGLRTQALVAMGAAAFVLFGSELGVGQGSLQIAAYVVSGVGFLGGGVILRQGLSVQGLNTAATLWCSAAVGCLAAGGLIVPALAMTVLVLLVHLLLRPLGRLVDRAPDANAETIGAFVLTVRTLEEREQEVRELLSDTLESPDVLVLAMSSHEDDGTDEEPAGVVLEAELLIEGDAPEFLDAATTRLSRDTGVRAMSWRAEESPITVRTRRRFGRG
ncbi:putative Mg2+ transporter-C (MgtC) family protein [Microbacterium sp. 1154]|uniref:MgtC/SapB family protein n=1 Tax=Microbacterium sp. 1154 TaxID=2817733 RepID=UPI000E256CE3|nr:MgtC/SapB family protein [Microbacterium sp. 1154]MDR6691649.1 putative Mg2+ transporter-C (MgtC) family protein [Microbacterium sp. 1154]